MRNKTKITLTLLILSSLISLNTSAQEDEPYLVIGKHMFPVRSVAFSPDGKTLASGGLDNTLLWNAKTGELLKTLTGLWAVAFSPDGNTIASEGLDGTISLWDANTGELLRTLEGELLRTLELEGPIEGLPIDLAQSVAFSPDGNTIASGYYIGTIDLWDANTAEHIRTLKLWENIEEFHRMFGEVENEDDIGFAWSVAFHPDGKTLAGSGWAGAIDLWDANTGEHIRTLAGHTGSVRSVAFSPDGKTLASGSVDNTLRLWNPNTGENLKTLKGHTDGVLSVAFHPDGKTLASGSVDGTIKLWDALD